MKWSLLIFILTFLPVFTLQFKIKVKRHRLYARRKTAGERFRIQGCGSRFVDELRFRCQKEMRKKSACNQATKTFCSTHPSTSHPLCRIDCSDFDLNGEFKKVFLCLYKAQLKFEEVVKYFSGKKC